MPHTIDIIELRADPLVLAVAPEACGAITRFGHVAGGRAIELLKPAAADAVAARNARGTSCFPLVPFSNRVRDGRFTFGGRTVTLPPNFPPEPHAVHGHGWQAAWTPVERGERSLTIEYRHRADAWPWPYTARQRYDLADDRLSVTITVANEAPDAMPAGFGLHPFFPRTPDARIRARVGPMWEADADAMPARLVPPDPTLATGLDPNAVALDDNFLGFDGTAHVGWPAHDAGLTLEADGPFRCLVVYTPPGKDFFCVEPATNCIDAFNLAAAGRDDTGMLVVPPGGTVTGTVRFVPEVGGGRSGG